MIEFQLAKLRKLFFWDNFQSLAHLEPARKLVTSRRINSILGSSFHFGNKSFRLFPFIYDLVSREVTNKASCQHLLAIWPYFPTYVHNYTRRRQQGTWKAILGRQKQLYIPSGGQLLYACNMPVYCILTICNHDCQGAFKLFHVNNNFPIPIKENISISNPGLETITWN